MSWPAGTGVGKVWKIPEMHRNIFCHLWTRMAKAKLYYLLSSSWMGLWHVLRKWEYHAGYLKISMIKVWSETLKGILTWNDFSLPVLVDTLNATSFTIIHIMVNCFWEAREETKNFLICRFKADVFACSFRSRENSTHFFSSKLYDWFGLCVKKRQALLSLSYLGGLLQLARQGT